MLVPLDGSKVAEQVLPYARFFARTLRVPVELVNVIDLEALSALSNPAEHRYIDSLVAERSHGAGGYLQTVGRTFSASRIDYSVEKGKPEEILIERAAADPGTLIAMATHGRSGIQRWLLGSVAEKILHGAANHLLLVRANEAGNVEGEAALKTVVVPLDGSGLAEKALPYAVDLAKKIKLEVVLMRAYALPPSIAAEDFGPNFDDLMKELETEARSYLDEKVEELKKEGIERVSPLVAFGYGGEEIIAMGRKTPDDLIAMCTHGRSGLKRWVLGSVTERVVRHSGDPVLIIRAAS
jgi:nucleotide-binding universal stress UspA family protein